MIMRNKANEEVANKKEAATMPAGTRNSRVAFGAWRHAKGSWSAEAQAAFKKKSRPVALSGREAKLIEAVSQQYSEAYPSRLVKLTETLVEDLWQLNIFPFPIGDSLMRNETACELFGKTVASLIEDFGDFSIVYVEEELDKKLLPETQLVGDNVYLVNLRVGMPVRDFLIWFKGAESVPRAVISEWTAIPLNQLDYVYNQLLSFLRTKLTEAHHYASRYSLPAFNLRIEGFNLAINNYSHMEVKVNQ